MMLSTKVKRSFSFNKFFAEKINGGTVLIFTAILSITIANSPWAPQFFQFWSRELLIDIGGVSLLTHNGHPMTLLQFINDALMAVFFFSVGLEIKREALVGELATVKKALFPVIAALGGMLIPILMFSLFVPSGEASRGMAIPMATDIAFSLGILALFGKRVPLALKIFITTLAVADDIGGIAVIALFYSGHLMIHYLLLSLAVLAVIYIGGMVFKVSSKAFYVLLGFVFWTIFLESGVHASIAGVLVALAVPARPKHKVSQYIRVIEENLHSFPRRKIQESKKIILDHDQIDRLKEIETASDKVVSPLQHMEDSLHPIINYFVMPAFALANAGVILNASEFSLVFTGLPLAIMIGLVVGKFVGIFSFAYLSDKLGWAKRSHETGWSQIAAVSMVAGIGFTVSLFIANLAYGYQSPLLNQAKMGIVLGSFVAGIVGYILLNRFLPKEGTEFSDHLEED